MTTPLVSVVIPAKNAAHTLGLCLDALRRQSYPTVEILLVDNGSTDSTVQIAESFGVRVLYCLGSVTAARNAGAAAAQGEFMLHIDTDMEVNPDAIRQCLEATQQGADVVILPERNVARGFWMRAYSFEKELVQRFPGLEDGRFFHRSWFERVGGYDEALPSAGDRDLFVRLVDAGARIGYIDVITLHHVEHMRIGDLFRKTTRYTHTSQPFIRKHGTAKVGRRDEIIRLVLLRWRMLARSPLRGAGWILLMAVFVVRDRIVLLAAALKRVQ